VPKKSKPEELYFQRVAEIMVRQGLNFRRAAEQIDVILLPEEAVNLERRKEFQRILWLERYKYFEELGSDPNRTKAVLLGGMVYDINKLREEGNFDKSLDGALKLAKVEYGVENNTVNVLGTLTQEEIDKIKTKLTKLKEPLDKVVEPIDLPNETVN
jgi:hypothetical protein